MYSLVSLVALNAQARASSTVALVTKTFDDLLKFPPHKKLTSEQVRQFVQFMQDHPRTVSVQEGGCALLAYPLCQNPDNLDALAAAGAVECAFAALAAHTTEIGVQECGCAGLSSLSTAPSVCSRVVSLGGVECAYAAMVSFPRHPRVLSKVCMLLNALVGSAEGCKRFVDTSGFDQLFPVLMTNIDSTVLLEPAMMLLTQFCSHASTPGPAGPAVSAQALRSGALDFLCAVMKQHRRTQGVATQVCVLTRMMACTPNNKAVLGRSKPLMAALFDLMDVWMKTAPVLEHAVGALRAISATAIGAVGIFEAGVVPRICKVLDACPRMDTVIELALGALANVAAQSSPCMDAVAACYDRVLAAMTASSRSAAVQTGGATVISNLARMPTGSFSVAQVARAATLLKAAASKFPADATLQSRVAGALLGLGQ